MAESFQITIKQSVFEAIGLSEEKYADETFTFESETAAEEWVAALDDEHTQPGHSRCIAHIPTPSPMLTLT